MTFSQLPVVQKDTIFGAAKTKLGPPYFGGTFIERSVYCKSCILEEKKSDQKLHLQEKKFVLFSMICEKMYCINVFMLISRQPSHLSSALLKKTKILPHNYQ